MAHFTGQVRLRLVGQPFILTDENQVTSHVFQECFYFHVCVAHLAKSAEMA